ncbi:hypothetical protein GCM10011512_24720 [Tersicoccus solisilvae]|uniref:Transglycosylase SLT domain-containing protein n=1 Tax=Tersicoccus solisilvae TaxID=1882339 RepID=A0ABQ1PGP4_9MICC|nr:lytic transglycosylase domain-containing protein [Tersicoccus solisilvae]GGC96747.1 hypothetical protein GCM10011512_24720 [Tersicoccus solisilvae]
MSQPIARARGTRTTIAVAVLAVTALVIGVAVALGSERRSSFAADVGDLDAAAVPHGWAPLVEAAAEHAGIPAPVLAAQIEVESNWRAGARSPVGAQGLSQFMPDTWTDYGRGGDPFDPAHAIAAQGRYLADLLELARSSGIDGDPVELALAGYNAGFGAVQRHDGIPPFPETERYVAQIRDRVAAYERPTAENS